MTYNVFGRATILRQSFVLSPTYKVEQNSLMNEYAIRRGSRIPNMKYFFPLTFPGPVKIMGMGGHVPHCSAPVTIWR